MQMLLRSLRGTASPIEELIFDTPRQTTKENIMHRKHRDFIDAIDRDKPPHIVITIITWTVIVTLTAIAIITRM